MKTAFLISSLSSGGAERVVSLLANELIKSNQVIIITLNKTEPFYPLNQDIKLIHLKESKETANFFAAVFSNISLIFKLIGIIKKYSIKRLFCFLVTSNIIGVIAAKLSGIRIVVSERNHPILNIVNSNNSNIWNFLRKILYKYADQLVLQTNGIKSYFSKFIHNNKITIIPNPVLSKNIDFSNKEKIILNVGRCVEQKNQHMLLHIFSKIDPSWKLILCGDGPLLNSLKKLSIDLNISDRVEFTGIVKNIDDYYARASIFAFTSNYEGFPNALLEAMSFGCSCISTSCEYGPEDLIKHNENGYLVPVGDKELFLKYLKKIIKDEDSRKDFQYKNTQLVEKYSLQNIAKQWNQL